MSEEKALTLPERAAVALGTAEHEKNLIALTTKYADIVELKNGAARDQCHAAYMELKNARTAIINAGKTAREDAVAFQKAVIAESDRLAQIVEPEQGRLQKLRDDFNSAEAAEKAAKAAAEAERIRSIKARIERFMLDAVTASDMRAADIDAHATRLSETVISLDEYNEFAGEAQMKRDDTVKWLRERQQQAAQREAEAARLAEERAALERERVAAAERERQAEAARREQEAKDRAERERVEAEQRAAQEKAAAAMRAEQEAHAKRMAAERAEIARQQAEIAAAKAEQERIERERQEAIEAEARAKREAAEAAAKLEADHAEALTENAAIDALRRLAAEARQQEEQRRAAEEERIRREHTKFIINGPGDVEIVKVIAEHYDVELGDAMEWMKKFDYAAADEYFAAANVAANHMEKAA